MLWVVLGASDRRAPDIRALIYRLICPNRRDVLEFMRMLFAAEHSILASRRPHVRTLHGGIPFPPRDAAFFFPRGILAVELSQTAASDREIERSVTARRV
ncbi:hypothetical protein [Microbacterium sp.]|uniref:hypothetical protein n=1 Tax=Microbacterium sp. TaxID=51671 RepID=UPI0037C56CB9